MSPSPTRSGSPTKWRTRCEYAHGKGVVHRDIKPENILLENGHAVVADFGIAHAVTASAGEKITMTGMSLGTPHYMSPEQAAGETVDARSDLYALGCMIYEMLAGGPPFTGPNMMAIMARHAIDPVPALRTVRPTVTAATADAIERALAKAPADRFPTVQEWRTAVAGAAPLASHGSNAPAFLAAAFHKPPPTPSTPLLGREEHLAAAASGCAVVRACSRSPGTAAPARRASRSSSSVRLRAELSRAAPPSSRSPRSPAASEVLPTVGIALDIAEAHGRSALDALCTVIGDRRVLLVLDNLEQVLDAAERHRGARRALPAAAGDRHEPRAAQDRRGDGVRAAAARRCRRRTRRRWTRCMPARRWRSSSSAPRR